MKLKNIITIICKIIILAIIIFSIQGLNTEPKAKTEPQPYITSTIEEINDNENLSNERYEMHKKINIILLIVMIMTLIIMNNYEKTKNRNYKIDKNKIQYYRGIPNEAEIVNYAYFTEVNPYGSKIKDIILTTTLDLINQKVLNIKIIDNPNRSEKIKYDFNIEINQAYNKFENLSEFENRIISILFSNEMTTKFDFEKHFNKTVELNNRFEELAKTRNLLLQIENLGKEASEVWDNMHEIKSNKPKKVLIIIMAVLLILAIINIFIVNPSDDKKLEIIALLVACIIGMSVCHAINIKYKVLKEKYLESYKQLYGLYKYLKDYKKLEKTYPIPKEMYEEYLVFANLFEINKEISKIFEDDLINQGYTEKQICNTYPILVISREASYMTRKLTQATCNTNS